MAISRSFDQIVRELSTHRPELRLALLRDAAEAFLEGSAEAGVLLRHCIQTSIGFSELSEKTGISERALRGYAEAHSDPSTTKLAVILNCLREQAGGVSLHVQLIKPGGDPVSEAAEE